MAKINEVSKTQNTASPVVGILAHVDAGKTTLSEALLYLGGAIRKMGRVDTRDAFLDTDDMERARGITIYSKTARFVCPRKAHAGADGADGAGTVYTLLDTPGHADFGAETERAVPMLDAAILLISAPDGVNAQVRQLFRLLASYQVPVFLFVNKMDQASEAASWKERSAALLGEIRAKLTDSAADFSNGPEDPAAQEQIALCSGEEALLERVMEGRLITDTEIRKMISQRKLFPVLFGSALKMQGIGELMDLLGRYADTPAYPEEFAARIYKITRDAAGERETWLKVTGGTLRIRQPVTYVPAAGGEKEEEEEASEESLTEKISGIRLYSGGRYEAVQEVPAGTLCAVTGLTKSYAGLALGADEYPGQGLLEAPLMWEVLLPQNVDPFRAFRLLKPLEEEEPMLRLAYDERKRVIHARLMGRVQREIIKETVRKRCGLEITFGRPSVVYRETIAAPVEGVGHFEPLRHYAEVHLLLEPGERGSGIVLDSRCSTDLLARQYQNLVLTHLGRRRHRGVLTGSELTDVRITLIGGRAHEKHTEGGDFRQAAFRAVRQGLMTAQSVLLEPWYEFEMKLPQESLGRALADLSQMGASFRAPDTDGETASVAGSAPVAAIDAYQETLTAYTKGAGSLRLRQGMYRECQNAEEVVRRTGYDPDADLGQPSGSVFCMHGAGMLVPWYEVRDYMHIDTGWRPDGQSAEKTIYTGTVSREHAAGKWDAYGRHIEKTDERSFKEKESRRFAAEEELRAIFERTYGPVRTRLPEEAPKERVYDAAPPRRPKKKTAPEKEYLLVDGYNMIYAWENLRDLAARDLKAARDLLLDILADYAGYVDRRVICVFDAYKVAEGQERVFRYHTLDVVFTRQAETADQYIEKAAHELQKKYAVSVATSDAVEQVIIFSSGARRLSAADLLREIVTGREAVREQITPDVQVRDGRLHTSLAETVEHALRGDRR